MTRWRNLFFSFSRARFSEKHQRKWTLKLSVLRWQKKKAKEMTTIFHGLFSYRPNKWSQTCGSWFHLSFEHDDIISMVVKSTDLGKLLSICLSYVCSFSILFSFLFFLADPSAVYGNHIHFCPSRYSSTSNRLGNWSHTTCRFVYAEKIIEIQVTAVKCL